MPTCVRDGDIIDLMDITLGNQNIAHCRQQVTRFYRGLAARRQKTASMFAEKCIPHLAWLNLLKDLYPGLEGGFVGARFSRCLPVGVGLQCAAWL